MTTTKIDIKLLKENPGNPRTITDAKFKALVKSVKDFPQMLELRPIVLKSALDLTVLGGNMRLRACIAAGMKEIPVVMADDLTPEQQREFIIKDNVGFGEWDWPMIANEWDTEQITEWGLDIPDFAIMPGADELIGEDKNKPPVMKITFPEPEDLQGCENDIQEVLNRKCPKAFYSVSAGEI